MAVMVGFQGVEGAYSELAAGQFFGTKAAATRAYPDFAAVFAAVVAGRVGYGILPVENSLTGSIHQNYDLLLDHDVCIVGEVKLRVSHNLLAVKGATLRDVRTVYSHPQALSQCAAYLGKLRQAVATPFFDTAGSARYVAESGRRDLAAVASSAAGKRYGLQVLASAIEDNEQNFTRFIVVAKAGSRRRLPPPKPAARGGAGRKTAIVFALKSIPGALHKALSVFALRDIDLIKIESRPIAGSPWEYMFYLDFLTPKDPAVGPRAVEHLKEVTVFLRVLGTFAAG
jgi:prephenate dehydratase